MKKEFLNGNGIDISKDKILDDVKHIYIKPNNFYSLRNFYKPETLDFIYSKDLVNESRFYRILLKEMFIYLKVGGKLIIRFKNNKIINYKKLLKEIKICLNDKIKIVYSKKDKSNLIVLKKIKSFLKKGDSINRWSFGIITNGKRNDWVEKQINSIKSQNIPNYEIIVCGKYFERKEKNFKYIHFTEKDNLGWITKKKNLICENAKYENLCVMHDRIVLDKNWLEGMKKYGNYFEILSCVIKNDKNERCGDWITYGNEFGRFPKIGLLEYEDNDKYGYLDGALYILKKSVWKKIKWNENLFWNQAEDIELNRKWYKEGFITRFNIFSSCKTLSWRHGNLFKYKFNKEKLGKSKDSFRFKSIIKFYVKKYLEKIK